MSRTRALACSLAALLVVVASAQASAEANAADFLKLVKSGDQTALQVLHAYAVGIQWHDAYDAQDRGLRPSICPPAELAITKEQDASILEGYIAKHPDMSKLPVGVVLVYAYVDTFPCKDTSKVAAGPAATTPRMGSDIEVQSLIAVYKGCIKKSAIRLAGSRAEAEVIARAAVESCADDRRTIFQHVTASDGLNLATELDSQLASDARSIAELAVVEARRK